MAAKGRLWVRQLLSGRDNCGVADDATDEDHTPRATGESGNFIWQGGDAASRVCYVVRPVFWDVIELIVCRREGHKMRLGRLRHALRSGPSPRQVVGPGDCAPSWSARASGTRRGSDVRRSRVVGVDVVERLPQVGAQGRR